MLVGRRHLRSNNSWMHNVEVLVKGKDRCTLQVHPDDAARLGLVDGAPAQVTSRVGAVEAAVEVTDDVHARRGQPARTAGATTSPGTRHGRRRRATRASTATCSPTSCAIDPLSGNAVLNGIPVTVSATSLRTDDGYGSYAATTVEHSVGA